MAWRPRLLIAAIAAGLTLALSPAVAAEAGAEALRACMEANVPPAARVNRFSMTTVKDGRSETLVGKMFLRHTAGERALTLQIDAPAHYRDSAYLFLARDEGEQMFVYLSATGRVRQISGASMDGAFFGSAFRYSDLRKALGMMSSAQPQRLADDHYDGGPVARLRLKDTSEAGSTPVQSTLLVEPKRCVPLHLRVEQDGALVREFVGARADITADEDRWYLAKGTMRDHEQAAETDVRLGELRGFGEIPSSLFHRSSFHHAVFTQK